MAAEIPIAMVKAHLRTWHSATMQQALQNGELSAKSYQSIFGWDDAKLCEAIERAYGALQRADIKPTEPWHAIRTADTRARFKMTSLKQLNAEADLVSQSFYSDGLFRLPHEKDGSPPPSWFEPTMVYNWRDPGVRYDFPTITQEFLRWVRLKAELGLVRDLGTTVEQRSNDHLSPTASPPPMKKSKLKQLLRKLAKQPSTAAQREGWRLKEAARARGKLSTRGRKPRRNTSSVESSPSRDATRGGKRRRNASTSPTRNVMSLGSSSGDVPSTRAVTPPRSRFLYEFEVEREDDGILESEGDYESDGEYES